MNRIVITTIFVVSMLAQIAQSIHQQQLEHYNALGNATADYYEANTVAAPMPPKTKAGCTPNKVVYGWHPYWIGNAYQNYDWDLLTHFSFFSYEVNATTGNANSTHGWATSAAVDAALASGNTKVTLCVTLFSQHNTFFGSTTAPQTLITNLINLVQSRGAHGVQIDFEGLPSNQRTNFANWMVDLSTQMKAAIPGSEVSTVLYAVDWNNVFDFSIMEPHVDHYIIMGYAYYYQGSSNTGPCDPLYHFGSNYNYSLSRSTSYYIDQGCPKDKYILGLPYYGYEWPTASTNIPAATTSNGVARTYAVVRNNSSGNYSQSNYTWDADSYTDIFAFNSGGTNKQCFITLTEGFRKRLEFVNRAGVGGMGIWALGYDDGYSGLWNGIEDYMTDCFEDSCNSAIHDFGGPHKNYYNDEDYTFTIDPQGSGAINFNFTQFDVEANYDYLYIYDGADVNAPQISGSPFTGTNSPGSFTSSTGQMTFRFTSDGATVTPGFYATYNCVQDNTPPTTSIGNNNWETQDFTATFTDGDDNALEESFLLTSDFDGSDWSANTGLGFFNDEFEQTSLSTDWTSATGTWNLANNELVQTDEVESNTNLYANLTQDNQTTYLYHWKGQINGNGTNRRAGIHFFCDNPSATQRGNSYMVYWRVDNNKCQIYKATGNVINIETDDPVTVNANTTYDFKILYNPATGLIQAYLDDVLVSSWTDSNPLTTGSSISLRTGNCIGVYDDMRVYKNRGSNAAITLGSTQDHFRYQNPNPNTPAGSIRSIVIDQANNWSTISENLVNVDWTSPVTTTIDDGLSADVDTFYLNTEISANYAAASDMHSGVVQYEYSIGTSAGATNVVNWTSNGTNTQFTHSGLNLNYGTTYYTNVRAINGAGLVSTAITTDGQYLDNPTQTPVANFSTSGNTICEGDSIQLVNTSQYATSYLWSVTGGILSNNTDPNPYVTFNSSGNYNVTLVASGPGGSNQSSQNINVTVTPGPSASATVNSDTLYLPNAIVSFTNSSVNSTQYSWDFNDGNMSTDANPWNEYFNAGTYNVMLVASNPGCADDTTYFEVVVLEPVSTSLDQYEPLSVHPNPFSNFVQVEGLKNGILSIVELTDLYGRLIYSNEFLVENNSVILNLPMDLAHGSYVLTVYQERNKQSFKLIK